MVPAGEASMTVISVLALVFTIIPILYWGIRLAWWLTRVAYISLLILIHVAGRTWRGFNDQARL
jgi:hypothetical protein